jgi:DNA-binding LytR/AlgR family response regulator
MAIVAMIITINIITRRHDRPQESWAVPVIDEVSSALMLAVALALPAAAVTWAHRTSPAWWRAAVVHGLAVLAFAGLHIGGFVGLRKLAFNVLLDGSYTFGPVAAEAPYELAKDFLAYSLSATAFWLMLRWPVARSAAASDPAPPAWFDIRDGARLVRAPLGDILAVRSAGNYAEFLLSDGRRPLMRASLGGLEARLAPQGFVRTHRSWLVNAGRVTGLRPEGSGDYAVELGAVEAPLSRRFPQALAALRS